MKFYLSSCHLGDNPQDLVNLFDGGNRVAIITNALDFSSDFERLAKSLEREYEDLSKFGLIPEKLDLKDYFHKEITNLEQALRKVDGVWVIGGNSFILRKAMNYSGFDDVVRELSNKFVYAGYSAGVCVLAPTLRGLELVDDPMVVPEGYDEQVIWDGLGLIDYCIAPHFASDHHESEEVDKLVEYYRENNVSFKPLRDGETIVDEISK